MVQTFEVKIMHLSKKIPFIISIISLFFCLSCEKPEREAKVETGQVTDIMATSAKVAGEIIDVGEGITEHGHCWGFSTQPTISDLKSMLGPTNVIGNYTSELLDLESEKLYYVRAYAMSGSDVVYGKAQQFITQNGSAQVITAEITDTTINSAKSGGNVFSVNGDEVIGRGVCWDTVTNFTLSNCIGYTEDSLGLGRYISELTKLVPGVTYWVKAYVVTNVDTSYGEILVFSTLSGIASLTTTAATNITATSAASGGNIIDDGGAAITASGVCWNTTGNPEISDNKTNDGSSMGSFTSQLTELQANTTYYIRTYTINSVDTTYGNQISFKTRDGIPKLTTTVVTNITINSGTSGGNITDDGGAPVTSRGVCWSISSSPTLEQNDGYTIDGSGTGNYSSQLTGLQVKTDYYVRAYAINIVDTTYGNLIIFKTGYMIPILTTTEVTNITATSVTSGGNITDDGGVAIIERGVCWDTTGNPTISDNKTNDGSGTGSFTSSLTGLTGNTTYYVRAYAINIVDTTYGVQINFKTKNGIATLTTVAATNITATTATSGGNITNDGGATITAKGVCWNTTGNPEISDKKTSDGSGTGSFTSQLTGLEVDTTYYIRAYAINIVDTTYGAQINFKTKSGIPTLTTIATTNITATSAISGGNITDDGGAVISAKGVCWNTTGNPAISDNKTSNGSGTGSYTSQLTGLQVNTTYYIRAYAINIIDITYGSQINFKTKSGIPTLTTTEITNITTTSVTSGGNITDDGGAAITAKGVCWSTSQNPTVADNHSNNGSGTGSFTSNLTNLIGNTIYYVKAYATNSMGTTYGNQQIFTTLASITTSAISNITATTASSGGTIDAGGGASITTKGVCWSTSANPNITNSKTNDGSGTDSFTSSLSGLSPCTDYYVRAYTTNAGGTSYGTDIQFTTGIALPTVTTNTISAITPNTASSGGNVTGDCAATVTARGVCWSTSQNPTVADNHTDDDSSAGSFTSEMTGLTEGTTYYVRAYATNSEGTAYGNQFNFIAIEVGSNYQGGIVAYILQPGDPGYVEGEMHGFIAAPSDQANAQWCGMNCHQVTVGTSTALGTGKVNTTTIVNTCGEPDRAAGICYGLTLNGYDDWFLPSKDELDKLYKNRNAIGGFTEGWYWSSSEWSFQHAWIQNFKDGSMDALDKHYIYCVRAIRAF